jgi:Flp pilus assembly pilin Flp
VSSIEYALLGALIAVVCVLAVTTVGSATRDLYMAVCNAVSKANNNPPC